VLTTAKSPEFGPLRAASVPGSTLNTSGASPVFVTTMCCGGAVVTPSCVFGNAIGFVVGEMTGRVPVPFRVTSCGLPGALWLIVSVAGGAAPGPLGVKVTTSVQLAPIATDDAVLHVLAPERTNCGAEKTKLEKVRLAVADTGLVIVSVPVLLVPISALMLSVVAEIWKPAVGTTPVPVIAKVRVNGVGSRATGVKVRLRVALRGPPALGEKRICGVALQFVGVVALIVNAQLPDAPDRIE
jgi:hypothetical protein